jgi:hypothetical protein
MAKGIWIRCWIEVYRKLEQGGRYDKTTVNGHVKCWRSEGNRLLKLQNGVRGILEIRYTDEG